MVSYVFSSLITGQLRFRVSRTTLLTARKRNVLINLTRGRGLYARRSFCIGIGNASKTTPIDSQSTFRATSGDGDGRPTFRFARKPIIVPVDPRNRREKYLGPIFYYGMLSYSSIYSIENKFFHCNNNSTSFLIFCCRILTKIEIIFPLEKLKINFIPLTYYFLWPKKFFF